MLPAKALETRKGECETCPKKDVDVTRRYGNMWMCETCWEKELKITAETNKLENQQKRVDDMNARIKENQSILEKSKIIDMNITMRTDVYNAATIPAVELKQAIIADETIPVDQKDFVYYNTCCERYLHLKPVIFELKEELVRKENEMRMWQIQARTGANKLSAELREQFKALDPEISYQPTTPKSVKPREPKKGKTFEKNAVMEAAKKYDVPASIIQTLVVSKNLTPEWAAKHFLNTSDGKACDCPSCTSKK